MLVVHSKLPQLDHHIGDSHLFDFLRQLLRQRVDQKQRFYLEVLLDEMLILAALGCALKRVWLMSE